jgi:ubiquinone/menaquinone biosynthesis C-methylase UbiE
VTRLHPAAQEGFARAAHEYVRGRPGYPAEALEYLAERLDLGPGRSVIDLAAGTGALTRPLLALRCDVVAVEPVAEMRAHLPAGARALDGTAERIPLPGVVADAVTVAQAFHWFDGDAALAEIHRVLRPDGVLALIWNRRVLEDPVNASIEKLVAPYRGGTPSHRDDWRAAFQRTTLFGPLKGCRFANEHIQDADGLADRVASISFIASLPADELERVVAAARELAADGPLTIPYRTEVLVCDRRG